MMVSFYLPSGRQVRNPDLVGAANQMTLSVDY